MDNQFTLTLQIPDLAAAINNLAAVLSKANTPVAAVPTMGSPFTTERTGAADVPKQNTVPVQPAANAVPAMNATAAPVPIAAVPTAAPQYTLEMLATAGSALVDAGKLDQLVSLLSKYGVDSLTSLAPENYGAVANELRALGARI